MSVPEPGDALVPQLGVEVARIIANVLHVVEAGEEELQAAMELLLCQGQRRLSHQFEEVSEVEC